jgi:hypothetical protein
LSPNHWMQRRPRRVLMDGQWRTHRLRGQ